MLAVQAEGATCADGRGPGARGERERRSREAFIAAGAVQCGDRTPGFVVAATALLERISGAERRADPLRAPGQHLPLHRLREHRRGRRRRGWRDGDRAKCQIDTRRLHRGRDGRAADPREGLRRADRSRGGRTSGSSRARARSSTTCAGTGWATSTSCARRTRTRASSRSTSRRRSSWTACTGRSRATRSRSRPDPFFEMSVEPGGNIKDYALAVGRVRHMGEPVAAVCAATRELARDAAELVEVDVRRAPGARRRARSR